MEAETWSKPAVAEEVLVGECCTCVEAEKGNVLGAGSSHSEGGLEEEISSFDTEEALEREEVLRYLNMAQLQVLHVALPRIVPVHIGDRLWVAEEQLLLSLEGLV